MSRDFSAIFKNDNIFPRKIKVKAYIWCKEKYGGKNENEIESRYFVKF
jgi:hypothetical protein